MHKSLSSKINEAINDEPISPTSTKILDTKKTLFEDYIKAENVYHKPCTKTFKPKETKSSIYRKNTNEIFKSAEK